MEKRAFPTHRRRFLQLGTAAGLTFARRLAVPSLLTPLLGGCIDGTAALGLEGKRILAVGDSITYGRGSTWEGEGYLHWLASWVPAAEYRNHGLPSATTAMMLERIDGWLREDDWDYLLLMGGTNDAQRQAIKSDTPVGETVANLSAMVDAARLRGVSTVLHELPPVAGDHEFMAGAVLDLNRGINALAASRDLPLVPNYRAFTRRGDVTALLTMPSGIHPNDAGYELIAFETRRVLEIPVVA